MNIFLIKLDNGIVKIKDISAVYTREMYGRYGDLNSDHSTYYFTVINGVEVEISKKDYEIIHDYLSVGILKQ